MGLDPRREIIKLSGHLRVEIWMGEQMWICEVC